MHQKLSLMEIKGLKEKENCPSCDSETEVFTYTEDGEEYQGRKCKNRCGWWGSI